MWRLKVILYLLTSFLLCGHVTELVGRRSAQWSNTWASESHGLNLFLTVPCYFVAVDKPQFSHLPNGNNEALLACGLVTIQ